MVRKSCDLLPSSSHCFLQKTRATLLSRQVSVGNLHIYRFFRLKLRAAHSLRRHFITKKLKSQEQNCNLTLDFLLEEKNVRTKDF